MSTANLSALELRTRRRTERIFSALALFWLHPAFFFEINLKNFDRVASRVVCSEIRRVQAGKVEGFESGLGDESGVLSKVKEV